MDADLLIRLLEILWSWPTVAVLLALLFKKPLAELFSGRSLKRLKAGTFEMEFDKGLQQVEAGLEEAKKLPVPADPVAGEPKQLPAGDVLQLPEPDEKLIPTGKIIAAWARLETALVTAVEQLELAHPGEGGRLTAVQALRILVRANILPQTVADSIESLRQLRNSVAHSSEPGVVSREQAREFEELSSSVIGILNGVITHHSARGLDQLLAQLNVPSASEVTVAPLLEGAVATSAEAASRQAAARRGKFVGTAGGVSCLLTRLEADRLISAGATFDPVPSSG